jgi:hypothetical protein
MLDLCAASMSLSAAAGQGSDALLNGVGVVGKAAIDKSIAASASVRRCERLIEISGF